MVNLNVSYIMASPGYIFRILYREHFVWEDLLIRKHPISKGYVENNSYLENIKSALGHLIIKLRWYLEQIDCAESIYNVLNDKREETNGEENWNSNTEEHRYEDFDHEQRIPVMNK